MHRNPAVSVLLPVFDAERYLDACLQSLASQTFADFEIVAVDDGSSDSTPGILDSWTRRDPRLKVVRTSHRGLVAALNTGLENAAANLVARMDADDLALPGRLELQHRRLSEQREIDVLGCRVTHFAAEQVGRGFRIYERWLNGLVDDADIRRDLFVESPLAHPSVMFRRETVLAAGGYRDHGWPEDYDLWLRLAAGGAVFSKVGQTLLKWRDHANRLTRTHRRYAVERFIDCKAHHLVRGPLACRRRIVIWGAGQTGKRLSRHLIRRGAPLEAFIDIDPTKCGRTLRRLPIVAPERLEEIRSTGTEPPIVLAAVASRGAREKIRRHLDADGWIETRDYLCVA